MKIINYVLAFIVFILGLSKFLMPLVPLNILGIIIHFAAALCLIKKPLIGYLLIIILAALLVFPYLVY